MLLLIIVFGTFVGSEPTGNNFGDFEPTEVKSCFYYNQVESMDKEEFLEKFQKLLKNHDSRGVKPIYFWQRIQNYVRKRYGNDIEAPYDWKDLSKDEFKSKFDQHYRMHLETTNVIWLEAGKDSDLEPSPCSFKQFNNEHGSSLKYKIKDEKFKDGNRQFCQIDSYECSFETEHARYCTSIYYCGHKMNNTDSCGEKLVPALAGCYKNLQEHGRETCEPQENSIERKSYGQAPQCKGINGEDVTCLRNFCSCALDDCNHPKVINHKTHPSTFNDHDAAPEDEEETNMIYQVLKIALPVLSGLFIIGLVIFYGYHYRTNYTQKQNQPNDSRTDHCDTELDRLISTNHNPYIPAEPGIDLSNIDLIKLLAQGRYGTVWLAKLEGKTDVAVKTISSRDRSSWDNEKDIYRTILPFAGDAPNVLKYIAADERSGNGDPGEADLELWIVTDYVEKGSLSDYLRVHELSSKELFNIISTMAKGLAFLHSDKNIYDPHRINKPAIAHRDFKSKNVLLKQDANGLLSAVISDFGLALKFKLGEAPGDSHPSVGTRRYMAPEILERAISFNRDAFLRIDIYAFALVMWECLTRCTDLPQGPSPYKLPYEKELGTQPTMDDIQYHVVQQGLRPLFQHEMPDAEKWNENPLFRDLCTTIVECWDADAEARLSAGLVLTRVEQMSQTLLPANKRPAPPPQPPRQTTQQHPQQQHQQQQHRHQQPQPTQLTQATRNPPQNHQMWYPDVPNPGGPPVIELSSIRFNNQPSHPFSHSGPFMQHHDFQPPNVSINQSGISPVISMRPDGTFEGAPNSNSRV